MEEELICTVCVLQAHDATIYYDPVPTLKVIRRQDFVLVSREKRSYRKDHYMVWPPGLYIVIPTL